MTTDDRPTPWGHASSGCYDEMYSGTFDTREAALDDAIGCGDYGPSGGASFVVVSGTWCDPHDVMPSASDILETAGERAVDNWHEGAAEDFPSVSPEAEAELDALLTAWTTKYLKSDSWMADGASESFNICATCKAVHPHDEMPDEDDEGLRICDACATKVSP